MTPLDSYLTRVARELRFIPPSKRDEELRELRSHLEQRVEDFTNSGLPLETAQIRVIREFGSPRTLGSKLCDVWEGLPFSFWRLISTLIGITILWYISQIVLFFSSLGLSAWDASALLPELPYVLAFIFALVPFFQGWLISHHLGRRGPLVTLLYFGFSLGLAETHPMYLFGIKVLPIYLLFFNLIMALCGSVCAANRQRHTLHLAFTGGYTLQMPSPAHRWRSLALKFLLGASVGAVVYLRTYTVFHPTTPNGVLRAALLSERGMNHDFAPPTILEMRELPPTTTAERSGQQKRIFFRVEVHATQEYSDRRLAFLKDQLANPHARDSWGEKYLRRSLTRLQTNSHQVQGTAILTPTPQGWQVDRSSFNRHQLEAWWYDIYYGGIDNSPA